jgi:hypothetical protein
MYARQLQETAVQSKEFAKTLPESELRKVRQLQKQPEHGSVVTHTDDRWALAKAGYTDYLNAKLTKSPGVSTGTGFNFYDLRGPSFLIYPVNTPFRNSLPRWNRVNDGVGTAAHWMATKNPGISYAGANEGQRGAVAVPDNNQYVATYKEIGVERNVTWTAPIAAEGYTDLMADEHIRGTHELWLEEESLMLFGNSGTGTGNNGFALGTPATPTVTLTTGTGLPGSTNVSVAVVAITALGSPNSSQYGYSTYPTVAGGLTPSYTRTNADASQTVVNGGISAISAMSAVVTTTGGTLQVTAAVTPLKGAFQYAWFVNTTDASAPSLANAKLAAITNIASYVITAVATGTQTGAGAGLNTDHSFNTLDFDGLITYAANSGTWTDLAGAVLTSGHDGSITEVDNILSNIWNQYQTGPQTIWVGTNAKTYFDKTVRAGGASTSGAYRFDVEFDQMGNMRGGYSVTSYENKYTMNPNGASAIPVRVHPMLPTNAMYFDVSDNPYPHSRIPGVRGMMVQRDYYGVEWAPVTRQYQFGTYCHEVLAHFVPWITAVLCGIGGSGT